MVRSGSQILAGMFLSCVLVCCAENSKAEDFKLYVGNSRGDNISIIDMASFKVTGEIKAGERVHGVCLQADGKRLFVTVESDQTLRIIDTASQQAIGTVKVSGRPNQCAVTPDGKYVAVPIRDGDSVDVVDVSQQKIVKTLPIKEPHNALNTGSNRYIYVSSMGSHEIDLIDLEKMDFAAHLPAGGRPRPYTVSSDGKTMYVAVADLHGFVIVDIPTQKVVERVEIPAEHATLKKLQYETQDTLTHGLALTPDGSELWVSSLKDDAMYIYDVKAKKVTGRVNTGEGPNWIVFTPDGKYACISNAETDDVSIIDVKTRREVTRVKVGKVPKRLAVADAPVTRGRLR
ncbi:MAG TPA: cytochrome D1 domain-containing protein [Candidatus Dormibacteraeota bacterium]|nr:cytochrome D1 domain-containing protein [Candidatus Dormibacteraeota bacterium]